LQVCYASSLAALAAAAIKRVAMVTKGLLLVFQFWFSPGVYGGLTDLNKNNTKSVSLLGQLFLGGKGHEINKTRVCVFGKSLFLSSQTKSF